MDDGRIADEMTLDGIARRLDTIQTDLTTVKQDVAGLKTDIAGLKTDVAGLKTDVTGLKTDVAGLKTDVAGLKTDVTGLKTDVTGLKTDVGGLMYEVQAGFKRVDSELNDARIRDENLHALMKYSFEARDVLRDEMHRRFDETKRTLDERLAVLADAVKRR